MRKKIQETKHTTLKRPNSKEIKGIKIRFIIYFMIFILTAMFTLTVLSISNVKHHYDEMTSATNHYIDARDAIDNLLSASDYLTEQARLFIMTGNLIYARNYCDEIEVTHRRENALASLERNLLENNKATQLLRLALQESNLLKLQELRAMHLKCINLEYDEKDIPESIQCFKLKDDDLNLPDIEMNEKCIDLVFGNEYIASKSRIVSKSDQAAERAEETTLKKQEQCTIELRRAINLQVICMILLLIDALFTCILTLILIISPLASFIKSISHGEKLKIKGSSECRVLASTYNQIYDLNVENQNELNYKAEHDALTGLLNRSAFDTLTEYLEKLPNPIALVMIDIDHFKNINDTYGHKTGDEIIQFVAHELTECFRNKDYFIRFGGDEFIVIMINLNSKNDELIVQKTKQVNEALKNYCTNKIDTLSVSCGVAFSIEGYNQNLFTQADKALYFVKEHGRHGIAFYDDKKMKYIKC